MNFLHINVYANGVISVRGNGENYNNFYKWFKTLTSSKDVKLNWPEHYFILNNVKEYKEFFEKYRKYINFVSKDYVWLEVEDG